MILTEEILRKILVAPGFISEEDFNSSAKKATQRQVDLADFLVDKELIKDYELGQLVANEYGYKFVNLRNESITDEVLHLIPEPVAKSQQIISFKQDADGVRLAMAEPSNMEVVSLIRKRLNQPVKIYYATPADIKDSMSRYSKELELEFKDIMSFQAAKAKGAKPKDVPVVKIVDTLLEYAYQSKASDVHIEPLAEAVLVRFRVDGILHEVIEFPKYLLDLIVSRLKIMSELHTDEHAAAQDGKLRFQAGKATIDVRVSILPIINGEKVVMRILSDKARKMSLTDLGLNDEDLKLVTEAYKKPYGMILSTGPTGSGKTTSIYSVLKLLNRPEINISTIEDPVEYDMERINQVQVNPNTNLTFAAGLRSLVRQDPDVIMVGEIRDGETAGIAVNSAMTGHLVLSTLHTNDSATTMPRLIDMGIEPFLIASTVNLIIAQRLARKICSKCIVSYNISEAEATSRIPREVLEKINQYKKQSEIRLYKGKGCEACSGSGYSGRVGVFEILVVSEKIRDLVARRATAEEIKKQAVVEGMTTMMGDGVKKMLSGLTTIDDVLRVTRE